MCAQLFLTRQERDKQENSSRTLEEIFYLQCLWINKGLLRSAANENTTHTPVSPSEKRLNPQPFTQQSFSYLVTCSLNKRPPEDLSTPVAF